MGFCVGDLIGEFCCEGDVVGDRTEGLDDGDCTGAIWGESVGDLTVGFNVVGVNDGAKVGTLVVGDIVAGADVGVNVGCIVVGDDVGDAVKVQSVKPESEK